MRSTFLKRAVIGILLLFSIFPGSLFSYETAPRTVGELIREWDGGRPQEEDSLVLIGFDTGDAGAGSLGSFGSYAGSGRFQALATLGITRRGDDISLSEAPFLAVPTMEGFRYINLRISSSKLSDEDIDEDIAAPEMYASFSFSDLSVSVLVTPDKSAVSEILNQYFPKGDALNSSYETVDYVTPDTLYTSGWSANVTFAASWFLGDEFVRVGSFDGRRISSSLEGLISEERYRQLLYDAHLKFYDSPPRGDEPFPWDSGPWHQKRDVRYTLNRQGGQAGLRALVPCWSNSSRRFNVAIDAGPAPASLVRNSSLTPDFDRLKSLEPGLVDLVASPGGETVYTVTADRINCYDSLSGSLLKTIRFEDLEYAGRWSKIIMVESALGRYVESWEKALEP